jgi:hypothetical protein
MRRLVVAVVAGAALVGGAAYALWPGRAEQPAAQATKPVAELPPAEQLDMRDLVAPGPVLGLSDRAKSLDGERVRMVGFMAHMEDPPAGGFYLVPLPVLADEAGGGTADLPPQSVLVVSRAAAGQRIPFIEGRLEVTGTLELGSRTEQDGRVTHIRLHLDGPPNPNTRDKP